MYSNGGRILVESDLNVLESILIQMRKFSFSKIGNHDIADVPICETDATLAALSKCSYHINREEYGNQYNCSQTVVCNLLWQLSVQRVKSLPFAV